MVFEKSKALEKVVGVEVETVIRISRPDGEEIYQSVVYNGHKTKQAIRCRAATSPCGIVMHIAGKMKERRHEWTMDINSELHKSLPNKKQCTRNAYFIFRDSGYRARPLFCSIQKLELDSSSKFVQHEHVAEKGYYRMVIQNGRKGPETSRNQTKNAIWAKFCRIHVHSGCDSYKIKMMSVFQQHIRVLHVCATTSRRLHEPQNKKLKVHLVYVYKCFQTLINGSVDTVIGH